MYTYKDTIELDEGLTLATVGMIESTLTGLGKVVYPGGKLMTFEIEAEDLWELRDHLCEVETELSSHGVPYVVDRDKVTSHA